MGDTIAEQQPLANTEGGALLLPHLTATRDRLKAYVATRINVTDTSEPPRFILWPRGENYLST
jgi:hypothetical protein